MPPQAMIIKIREMQARETAAQAKERDIFDAFVRADTALMALGKIEREATGDTTVTDRASRELNRLVSLAAELENKLAAIREIAS